MTTLRSHDTRELEDTFVDAAVRARDAGKKQYVLIAPTDTRLAMTLRLRRLGFKVAESVLAKPGQAYLLDGHPCANCGDPVDDDRLRFCTPCSRRGASGTV